MAKKQMQKAKLLVLYEYLKDYTDEEHGVSVEDIIEHLSKSGISAERKSIYSDIDALVTFGVDIISRREGKKNVYFLASRLFEIAELKMLVDIISASRFTTPKKSEKIIKKLESLCSKQEARQLSRQTYITGRVKNANEIIYLNVDKIHSAFTENCSIKFKYFYYDWKKEKSYRRDGALYDAVPLSLLWNNDNYYLVAFDRTAGEERHFRVDKMEKVSLFTPLTADERELRDSFDQAKFSKRVFDMFGGESALVELAVPETLVSNMYDKFGMDIVLRRLDQNHFSFVTEVELSPSFFAWISNFEGEIKILSPERAREKHKLHIEKLLKSVEV
jgi:predicted DNA-binding transcriptional regulator YafY